MIKPLSLTSRMVDVQQSSTGSATNANSLSGEDARSEHLENNRFANLLRESLNGHIVPHAEGNKGVREVCGADWKKAPLARGRVNDARN